MLKSILKKLMITILVIISIFVVAYLLFTNYYPSFGGSISKEKELLYTKSSQFKDGKFHNVNPVPKDLSFVETLRLGYKFFTTKVTNGRPKKDLNVTKIDSLKLTQYQGSARLFWFGHSSFLLQMNGKIILIDPMFGNVAAPHKFFGSSRFNKQFPLSIEKLPKIDAVMYSHDHYDHLDYETLLKIKGKVANFFVPLGVGSHLDAWGVEEHKITELDWWQSISIDDIKMVCTPAQHFSGRKFDTNQTTLWSSWVITSKKERIFFSGDSGYSTHFKEIGEQYGPFDIALMECGQYNKMWPDIHMMPEETAKAAIDVRADKLMPIHWGGFKLALHSWTDPIQRVSKKAKSLNIHLITPEIGEEIVVRDRISSFKQWWKHY